MRKLLDDIIYTLECLIDNETNEDKIEKLRDAANKVDELYFDMDYELRKCQDENEELRDFIDDMRYLRNW